MPKRFLQFKYLKETFHEFSKATKVLISRIRSGNIDWVDIWYYVQGTTRTIIYYRHPEFLRQHIKEQFEYRLEVMKPSCLESGECICECKTPDLQMADKACVGDCYPKMMSRNEWLERKGTFDRA